MLGLRSKGGEMGKGASCGNFNTGERNTSEKSGVLPGKSSRSFLKLPPATAPTLALILVGILPGYLSSLYGAYTEKLMEAYIVFGYLFIMTVVGGLSIMVFRDRSALSRSMKVFRFRPSEPVSEAEGLVPIRVQNTRTEKE
jgi:hypothetical protein